MISGVTPTITNDLKEGLPAPVPTDMSPSQTTQRASEAIQNSSVSQPNSTQINFKSVDLTQSVLIALTKLQEKLPLLTTEGQQEFDDELEYMLTAIAGLERFSKTVNQSYAQAKGQINNAEVRQYFINKKQELAKSYKEITQTYQESEKLFQGRVIVLKEAIGNQKAVANAVYAVYLHNMENSMQSIQKSFAEISKDQTQRDSWLLDANADLKIESRSLFSWFFNRTPATSTSSSSSSTDSVTKEVENQSKEPDSNAIKAEEEKKSEPEKLEKEVSSLLEDKKAETSSVPSENVKSKDKQGLFSWLFYGASTTKQDQKESSITSSTSDSTIKEVEKSESEQSKETEADSVPSSSEDEKVVEKAIEEKN